MRFQHLHLMSSTNLLMWYAMIISKVNRRQSIESDRYWINGMAFVITNITSQFSLFLFLSHSLFLSMSNSKSSIHLSHFEMVGSLRANWDITGDLIAWSRFPVNHLVNIHSVYDKIKEILATAPIFNYYGYCEERERDSYVWWFKWPQMASQWAHIQRKTEE